MALRRFWQLVSAVLPGSRLKVFLLRLSGAHIGLHVKLRRGSRIIADEVSLGDGVVLEPNVHIACRSLEMGEQCKIDSETVVYGEGDLVMKDHSYIGPRAWVNPAARILIGRGSGVGPGSMIFTHGVWLPYLEGYPRRLAEVVLGEGVWVPAHVTILPGVTIGDGAMIGAGAVVSKDVPARMFAAGVPAKPVSSVTELMAPDTPDARDARAREMIRDFGLNCQGRNWPFRPEGPPLSYSFGTGRSARAGVLYLREVVAPEKLRELDRLRTRIPSVLLVALEGLDADSRERLREIEWVTWFDLAAGDAKDAWTREVVAFRRYLASHWGMRFNLIRGA